MSVDQNSDTFLMHMDSQQVQILKDQLKTKLPTPGQYIEDPEPTSLDFEFDFQPTSKKNIEEFINHLQNGDLEADQFKQVSPGRSSVSPTSGKLSLRQSVVSNNFYGYQE